MTANQIAYQQLEETRRSNAAKEAETNRSNVAKEVETNRSNRAKEQQQRDELVETARSNIARELETARSNRQNEIIGLENVNAKKADTAVKGITNVLKLF